VTYTIGELGRAFGLSRSTLLYYDKLGLLKPSGRSGANYRCYSECDYKRLAKIMTYRNTGMSLQAIGDLITEKSTSDRVTVLEAQLDQLNQDIAQLRKQQQITLGLLSSSGIDRPTRSMSKKQWVRLLESIGMSDEDMLLWHREFEQRMPEAHQDFLESLNIPATEIQKICKRSRVGPK